jgi:hypothetical protein
MIQLRWKKITHWSQGVVVEVDGQLCVLQYRLNFIPTTTPELGEAIVLKEARPIDNEWRDIAIDEFNGGAK